MELETTVINSRKKIHPFYLGAYLLFAIFMIVHGFFTEGFSFFDPVWYAPMTDFEFFITFSATLLSALSLIVLAHKKFKIKPNYILLFLGILFIVVDGIALFTTPAHLETIKFGGKLMQYDFTVMERCRHLASWTSSVIGLYLILGVVPKMFYSQSQFDRLANLFIIAVIGVIIADTIHSWQYYYNLFGHNIAVTHSPGQICGNKNTYARVIVLGFYCCMYMHSKYKGKSPLLFLYTLCMWAFFIFIAISGCKTQFAILLFTLPVYGIWCFFNSYKKRKAIVWTKAIFYVVLLVVGCFIIFSPSISATEGVRKVITHYLDIIFKTKMKDHNYSGRESIWVNSFHLIFSNPRNIIFGFGDRQWEYVISYSMEYAGNYFPIGCSHSAWLFSWGRFGIFGFLGNLFINIYYIVLVVRALHRKNNFAFGSLLMFIGVFLTGLFEDVSLLDLRAIQLLTNVMLFVPLLVEENRLKQPFRNDRKVRRLTINKKSNILLTDDKVVEIASFISMIFMIVIIGFGPIYNDVFGFKQLDNVASLVAVFLSAIYLPIAVALALVYRQSNKKNLYITYLILGALLPTITTITVMFTNSIAVPIVVGCLLLTLYPYFKKEFTGHRIDTFYNTFLFFLIGIEIIIINNLCSGFGFITVNTRYGAIALAVLDSTILIFTAFLSPFAEVGNFIGLDLAHRAENAYFKHLFRLTARSELRTINTSH